MTDLEVYRQRRCFSKFVPDFKSEIQDIISLEDGNSVIIEYFNSKDKLSWFGI